MFYYFSHTEGVTLVVPQHTQPQETQPSSHFPVIHRSSIVTQKAQPQLEKEQYNVKPIVSIMTRKTQLEKGRCMKKKPPTSTIVPTDPMLTKRK